jgi:molybdenum cofactor cytidylyltransferase
LIGTVVLAAGMSKRMGRPKLILPWGATTVLGQVIQVLLGSGLEDIVVVTGGAEQAVALVLRELPVRTVLNLRYKEDNMALSLQVGLAAMGETIEAAMVALGDQPQIEETVVRAVINAYHDKDHPALVVPSYQMRRGHPWIIDRRLWPAVMGLQPPKTLRDLLWENAAQIQYLEVDSQSILLDLDTPADYEGQAPRRE